MNVDLNLQNQKLELIQWLLTLENSTVIEKIMDLRKQENTDWWNLISEEEKISVERGLADAEAGNFYPHSKARALYEKWL